MRRGETSKENSSLSLHAKDGSAAYNVLQIIATIIVQYF